MPVIVILDDRASNRTIYARLAAKIVPDVKIVEFDDPTAATEWLATNEPDLVLTDFRMPSMDGAEFTKLIRSSAAAADVPVIVVSAYNEPGYSTTALDAGATEFLRLPLDHAEFQTRVRNVLKMHRQHKQLQSRALILERELKESEQVREHLVRDSREGLAQVIDTIPAFISARDKDGRCVFMNAYLAAIAGLPSTKVDNTEYFDLFGIEHAQRDLARDQMVLKTGTSLPAFEEQVTDAKGNRMVLLTTKAPLRNPAGDEVMSVLTTSLDITARKTAEDHLVYVANHDPLTDLPNRLLLTKRVEAATARIGRGSHLFALHFVDLDHFKTVNDTLGHLAGDEVLREVAARISARARDVDTVARIGGDEFAVLQTGVTAEVDAERFAARITAALRDPFEFEGKELTISGSVGTTMYPKDGRTFAELINNADLAMYASKLEGRNASSMFRPALTEKVGWRLKMKSDLRRALAGDEFYLVYQPQIDFRSGLVVGVEALLRWRQPNGTETTPGEFLPVAEEAKMSAAIDAMVIKMACTQAASWIAEGLPKIRCSVNISPAAFDIHDVKLMVERALKESGVPASYLEIEMTEQTLATDIERTILTLQQIRDLGVRIAVDDFGIGYSTMQSLKDYPINGVKIDRSFVTNVSTDARDATIVKAIISLGQRFGLTVIAEGVETVEQLMFLVGEGCYDFQGYYFSEPVSPNEISKMVREGRILPGRA